MGDNKPKRPLSAYFLFLADMREKIKKDNPGISITDITRKAGVMWKEVGDKSKWEKKAAELKKGYEVAMADYKESGGGKAVKETKGKTSKRNQNKKESKPTKSQAKSEQYVSGSDESEEEESDEEQPQKMKKARTG